AGPLPGVRARLSGRPSPVCAAPREVRKTPRPSSPGRRCPLARFHPPRPARRPPGRLSVSLMKIIETSIPGLVVFEPTPHRDERGYFSRTYDVEVVREAGIDPTEFKQENQSR